MNKKVFKYKLEVEDVPYNEETVEYLFGEDAEYNSNFPEDIMAKQVAHGMVEDAIMYCLQAKVELLEKTGQELKHMNKRNKAFFEYLQDKEQQYRKIQKTICLIKE